MHERVIYDTGGTGHPELEELAALLDGKLSAEEEASLRAHLAHCEPCLALLAETASFLRSDEVEDAETGATESAEPEATPLPWKPREVPRPRPPRPRKSRRWAAVAAAVAALTVATVAYQRERLGPPRVDVARLLTSLAGRQTAVAGAYWGPVQRGASVGPNDRSLVSFRLGVELVSFAVGDRGQALAAATRIHGLLKAPSAGIDTKRFFRDLPARIDSGAPLAVLAEETAKQRRHLEGYLAPTDYDFGRWAEAGRLAAAAAAPEFLTAPDTRRFPGAVRGRLSRTPARAAAALDGIAAILDHGDLTGEDYKALESRFGEILEAYYPVV